MARWHSCNVFQADAHPRGVWQFNARKDDFVPAGSLEVPSGKPLPSHLAGKAISSLWQKKLNVAWLPPEQVFLRVIQLPSASLEETRAMVELQLEKLSPMPSTQIVWSMHILPTPEGKPQTIIVILAARERIEQFLGKVEGDGFLADRLELPLVDQLCSAPTKEDAACVYPGAPGGPDTALVAWWFGGTLQQLGLVGAPPGPQRAAAVAAQFAQLAWAGELEGWFTGAPAVHLVASPEVAAQWEPLLRQALGIVVQVHPPLAAADLALATARRAGAAPANIGILPPEYSQRYQQQFVDRLWMRGLFAVFGLYTVGVLIYLAFVGGQYYRANALVGNVKSLGPAYTNALQLEARYQILKDRQDLKFAALECWKATAESLPEGSILQALDFRDGKVLILTGTAAADQVAKVLEFNTRLRKATINGQSLFSKVSELDYRQSPGGNDISWSFKCELHQAEAL
jgi:hypothetical protein